MTRNDFAALALGYVDEITAYARRLTGNAWDADDLVQATFENAFRGWRQLREPAHCRAGDLSLMLVGRASEPELRELLRSADL